MPQSVAARQIEQTERAFAEAAGPGASAQAFRRYAAPDAVMFLPGPVMAVPILQISRWPGALMRRPQYIGVALSGDLGFSLGPSLLKNAGRSEGGVYLTLWRREPGGPWRIVLTRAADMPASVFEGPPQPLTILGIDPASRPDLSEGLREIDSALNADLSRQIAAPFAGRLDDQILAVRANRPVAFGKRRALKLLSESPTVLEAQLLHGGVSLDATLGYAYGKMRWSTAQGTQQGYYVRVWRNAGQGWRLLVDHLAER